MNSPLISAPTQLDANIRTVQAQCERHGEYAAKEFRMPFADMKPMLSGCPTCSAERAAEDAEHERRTIEDRKRQRIAKLLGRSQIPARFADRTLETYRAEMPGQQRALTIAKRFVDSFADNRGASLILAGGPGTGKTHIACGIARAGIEQHDKTVMFMTVLQAIRHVKDTYRRDSERSERDAINDLLEPELLILDEIGAQLGSEHEKMLMFEIINERYQQCRSTILISNLTREELGEFLGDRVMDRFRESGAVIPFDWQSHRGRQAA